MVGFALKLEAGLVDDLGRDNLRIAELNRLFRLIQVVGIGEQREGAQTGIVFAVVGDLVARRQGVVGRELHIHSGAEIGPGARIRDRFRYPRDGGVRGQGIRELSRIDRRDGRKVVDVAPRRVDKEGCLLRERPAQVPVENFRVVAGLYRNIRVLRVENRIAVVEEKLPVELVAARLGEDFDAPISQLVILRRKRILVDANLANCRLRRQLPAGKSVNVNLPAIGPGRRTRQRLQLRLQFVGIVGERLQVLAFDHERARVRRRPHREFRPPLLPVHLDLFFLRLYLEGQVQIQRAPRRQHHARLVQRGKPLGSRNYRVRTRSQGLNLKPADGIGGGRVRFSIRTRHHHGGLRNYGSGFIRDFATQCRGLRLRKGAENKRNQNQKKEKNLSHKHESGTAKSKKFVFASFAKAGKSCRGPGTLVRACQPQPRLELWPLTPIKTYGPAAASPPPA